MFNKIGLKINSSIFILVAFVLELKILVEYQNNHHNYPMMPFYNIHVTVKLLNVNKENLIILSFLFMPIYPYP